MTYNTIYRVIFFMLILIGCISCEIKSSTNDCDDIVELNNSFCLTEIHELNYLLKQCSNYYDSSFSYASESSSLMYNIALDIDSYSLEASWIKDSLDYCSGMINNVIRNHIHNNRKLLNSDEILNFESVLNDSLVNSNCSTALLKMQLLNRSRYFIYLLFQDVCSKEQNMHLNRPACISVFNKQSGSG